MVIFPYISIGSDTWIGPETKPSPTTHVVSFCTPVYAGSLPGGFTNLLDSHQFSFPLRCFMRMNLYARERKESLRGHESLARSSVVGRAIPGRKRQSACDDHIGESPSGEFLTSAQKDGNDYAHLTALFAEMAALPEDDPDRDRVRTQIIETCLPIAEHIAARYRGRGQTTRISSRQQAWVWLASSTDSTSAKGTRQHQLVKKGGSFLRSASA